jgi:hypothetical protein
MHPGHSQYDPWLRVSVVNKLAKNSGNGGGHNDSRPNPSSSALLLNKIDLLAAERRLQNWLFILVKFAKSQHVFWSLSSRLGARPVGLQLPLSLISPVTTEMYRSTVHFLPPCDPNTHYFISIISHRESNYLIPSGTSRLKLSSYSRDGGGKS